MDLYICEKPSQGRDLAAVLGASQKGEGCLHNGSTYVTWAIGHLLELYMPDDYDESLKAWSLDTLPIVPEHWRYHVKRTGYKQFKVISELIQRASTVYIATDFDREGEAIARSLLDRTRYQGPIRRVCLTALDDASIRKALNGIKDGDETLPLYYSALARQRADWLVGMNASRLFTVLGRKMGLNETLHIGRVITPTINLVCQRDAEINAFKPSPYWVMSAAVFVQNGQFNATWIPPEECADHQGRCINKPYAEQVLAQVKGSNALISKAETKKGKESAPLPFDLTSLQQYASKRWGYSAQQVLDAAQSLYETHKATTYPRTDSRYLPESQQADIPAILQAIILSDQNVSGLVAGADTTRKSRAFNDAKVTAHHAIIPTPGKTDIAAMSQIEFNLYDAIRRFYIAQFYSDFEFNRTQIEVECAGHRFQAKGKTPLKHGWKVLFGSDKESDPKDDSDDDGDQKSEQSDLPEVHQGEPAMIGIAELLDKMTRPPPHFTEATLLAAMDNIARFVTEEKFKQILRDTAGLGTPATRAGIIQGAVDKGYLQRKKRVLISTPKAHGLVAVVPGAIRSPGMTAAWEQELEKIASGDASMNVFMQHISNWITGLVTQIKGNAATMLAENGAMATAFGGVKPATHECFNCGGMLKRIKGKNGFFWGCQNEACRKTFPDNRGKPEKRMSPEECPACEQCGKPMRLRKGKAPGKKRASKFWGCSGYPECKSVMPYSEKKGAGVA